MFKDQNGNTEASAQNIFAFLNEEAEAKEKNSIAETIIHYPEAYQIKRQVKTHSFGKPVTKTEVIDTIMVKFGDSETAKQTAIRRAKVIGNCFVVEKSERVIDID